jgi:tRNA (Thr-GGU) A37 N-methylase
MPKSLSPTLCWVCRNFRISKSSSCSTAPIRRRLAGARRSRGREDWPLTGILAQRAKDRPNRLGVTVCRLQKVEKNILHVQGLDAIDGTPVLDIKPVMRGFLPRGEIREPKWAGELMAGYWE